MTAQRAGNAGQDDGEEWRQARRLLNQRRHELASAAGRLYPRVPMVGNTGLLCRKEWLPDQPVQLDQLRLRWTEPPPEPAISGTAEASAHLRPRVAGRQRYRTYADAVAALDPPALFENRPVYRPLAADLTETETGGGPFLNLTRGRYFDSVSVAEALGHEFAGSLTDDRFEVGMTGLPFRAAIGDPCDLSRRPVGVAVSTLTLRRSPGGGASFPLHWRDPAKVTHAGGLYQVIPVGIFQPISGTPESECVDLSLWRGMVREFSEELLGASEDYSTEGDPFPYDRWDFYRRLTDAREAGKLRVWCLGMGVDPLTLVADILTVAVFDSDLYDDAFASPVSANAEGRVITSQGETGFSFTEQVVSRFTSGAEPMQAAGAAVLQLAWTHRALLLS